MTFAPDVGCGLIKEGGEVNLDEALPQALPQALPRWDRRERHRISCDAPSAAVMRAAEEVMCREAPIFYGLMAIMSLGHPPFSADEPVPAPVNMHKFEVLARTEEEILVGGTGRFSQSRPVIRLRRPDLAAFRDFEEPGCIKIGVNFRRAHGMLTTEPACGRPTPNPGGSSACTGSSSVAAAALSGTCGFWRSFAARVLPTSHRA